MKKTAQEILDILKKEEIIEMETELSMLTIRFRKFYTQQKTFNFELNGVAVDGCKTPVTALKKIQKYVDQGFTVVDFE
jgi:hypothetical protein